MKNLLTKQFVGVVILSAIYSVILNSVLLFVAKSYTGAPAEFGPFMYSSVIGLTALGVVAAGVTYILIGKFCKKQLTNWTVISLVVLMLSFIPDVLLPMSTAADDQGSTPIIILILMIMHVIPAWIVICKFNKYAKNLANNA